VVAMQDVDVDFTTHFVTTPSSGIITIQRIAEISESCSNRFGGIINVGRSKTISFQCTA
jgi:hypothetical protein